MTDKTMTLEQVRDWHIKQAGLHASSATSVKYLRMADAITRHLSQPAERDPIPMILYCPLCGTQHIDAPETHHLDLELDRAGMDSSYSASWNNPPHRSHLCHSCGAIWRPADVPTVGVARIETRGKADTFDPTKPIDLPRRQIAERGEAVAVDERCPHGVRHPHPCRECEDGAPARDDLYRAALNASGCIFRWRTSGIQPSYREFMAAEEALDKAIHARLTAPPPAAGVPDGWKLVPERIVIEADAWENAQFAFGGPGTGEGESYIDCTLWVGDIDEDDGSKTHGLHLSCNEVPEDGSVTLAKFSATPSPTIDVAAVREVIESMPARDAFKIKFNVPDSIFEWRDKIARAIGDAK